MQVNNHCRFVLFPCRYTVHFLYFFINEYALMSYVEYTFLLVQGKMPYCISASAIVALKAVCQ